MSNPEHEKKKYKFFVDEKQYEIDERFISGQQIRDKAQIDPSFQLFLEEPGEDKPDRLITAEASIDLAEPGVEKFYTVPPATFGVCS